MGKHARWRGGVGVSTDVVQFPFPFLVVTNLSFIDRISKTMGESFKLHAQALVGYEGELLTDPATGMDTMPGQGLMTVETAY
jgi:hypothetical protein